MSKTERLMETSSREDSRPETLVREVKVAESVYSNSSGCGDNFQKFGIVKQAYSIRWCTEVKIADSF